MTQCETQLLAGLKTTNVLDFLEFAVAMELTGLEQNCIQVKYLQAIKLVNFRKIYHIVSKLGI